MTPRVLAALFCFCPPAPSLAGGFSRSAGSTSLTATNPAFVPVIQAVSQDSLGDFREVEPWPLRPFADDIADMAHQPGFDPAQALGLALENSLVAGLEGTDFSPPRGPQVPDRLPATELFVKLIQEDALGAYIRRHENTGDPRSRETIQNLGQVANVLSGLRPSERVRFVERLNELEEVSDEFLRTEDPAVLRRLWDEKIMPGARLARPVAADAVSEAEVVRVYLDPAHLDGDTQGKYVEDPGYRELMSESRDLFFPGGRPAGKIVDAQAQLEWLNAVGEAAPDILAHMVRVGTLAGRLFFELTGDLEVAFRWMQKTTLHDIGKLGVLEYIRLPRALTGAERRIVEKHPVIGERYSLLGIASRPGLDDPFWRDVGRIAYMHHEKLTGGGYPAGRTEEALTIVMRIIFFSDVVDSLASRRPYKEPYPVEKTLRILFERPDEHDPRVWGLFLGVFPRSEKMINRAFRDIMDAWRQSSRRRSPAGLAAI